MNGILIINKPEGITSFQVIAKLRGMTKFRKIGHAGTLDPMATGVLPVFFGKSTRLLDYIENHDKGYLAHFQLGISTDTLDRTGTMLSKTDGIPSKEQVLQVIGQFRGEILQLPPMYSAVKVDGQRLYSLARQGIQAERMPRKVTIKELDVVFSHEKSGQYGIRVLCSKGTYIRSLCADIGDTLGCGAVLTGLHRYSALGFEDEDAIELHAVQELCDQNRFEESLLSPEAVLERYPSVFLDEQQERLFRNGVQLDLQRIQNFSKTGDSIFKIYNTENRLLGLGRVDYENASLSVERMLD